MPKPPSLHRCTHPGGVAFHTDHELFSRSGIRVAFSERTGGVSTGSYQTLNLAGHVDDQPSSVDENRRLLLASLGVEGLAERLTTAEQVHGRSVGLVTADNAGAGAYIGSGPQPIAATDALITTLPNTPLMMMYADCVPVVLVAETPVRSVAVVHAGWRGALVSLPGLTACRLAEESGCDLADLAAYVGAHVGACCYRVGDDILSQFCNKFDTIAAVDGRLDLNAVVTDSLVEAGVARERITRMAACTAESTDRFFSYRANRVTGRHGALALIMEVE